jgi:hypothetical protein
MNPRDLVTVTRTEEDTILWMQQNGYLHNKLYCLICNRKMKQVLKKGSTFFCCFQCRTERSILFNSIFKCTKIKINQILDLLYFWAVNALQTVVLKEARISRLTANKWYLKFRHVCYEIMRLVKPKKIGGCGMIVQIDESKFSKRKYNVGRLVKSVWVIGGIDERGEIFFVEVLSRSKEVISNIKWIMFIRVV